MAHWTSAAAQVRALAKAVSAAFAASNLTPDEKNPGKIEISSLPWQAPPLLVPGLLAGAPLQDYLDVPVLMNSDTLHTFWTDTLNQMWLTPGRLLRRGALLNCGRYMPKIKVGQRALRFAVPAGYPAYLEDTAGAIFSLEVAHAALTSLPTERLVSDDDNYFVMLRGQAIGIRNGLPACGGPWTQSVSGIVQDLLSMPRGNTTYDCQYDQIASLRSVLHTHRKSFPKNFDAIDGALQALRLLTLGSYCPELVQEMQVAPIDMMLARVAERALRDAVELMDHNMSDRSKLEVLRPLLVPDIISATSFRMNIFSGTNYPFTLATGRPEQIKAWLVQEYNRRIPVEMRQLKESYAN